MRPLTPHRPQWKFDGSHCAARHWQVASGSCILTVLLWLDQLIHELQGQDMTCSIHKGHILRRLLRYPLRSELLRRISQMPDIADAVAHGSITLSDH